MTKEPEIVSLARRMHEAYVAESIASGKEKPHYAWEWDALLLIDDPEPRMLLAAAIVARPDLAEGVSVEPGHWAAGVLGVRE